MDKQKDETSHIPGIGKEIIMINEYQQLFALVSGEKAREIVAGLITHRAKILETPKDSHDYQEEIGQLKQVADLLTTTSDSDWKIHTEEAHQTMRITDRGGSKAIPPVTSPKT